MKRTLWPFLICAAAVLATLYEIRTVSRMIIEQQASQRRTERLKAQSLALRRHRDATSMDLEMAEHELTELQSLATGKGDPDREKEIRAWLARVKELKHRFEEYPDQKIPEMNLLTDDDWIRVAQGISFSDDDATRTALAAARNAAKSKFCSMLAHTLHKYAQASNGQLPKASSGLAPYLSEPEAVAALSRYEMTATAATSPSDAHAIPAIREIAAIDPDYDSRFWIYSNGGWVSLSAPVAWIDNFSEARAHAYQAYARANSGASAPSMAELIPYFDPPLDSAIQQKVLKLDQAH